MAVMVSDPPLRRDKIRAPGVYQGGAFLLRKRSTVLIAALTERRCTPQGFCAQPPWPWPGRIIALAIRPDRRGRPGPAVGAVPGRAGIPGFAYSTAENYFFRANARKAKKQKKRKHKNTPSPPNSKTPKKTKTHTHANFRAYARN